MTDTIQIPVVKQSRLSRVSRHRLSTTPPMDPSMEAFEEEDFLSEDSEDESNLHDSTVQLLFNKIYVDPLQDVFEAIDGEAGSILRTGRFGVAGDTGSMDLLQPLLFSLQSTEDSLTLLLPQLMKIPFFNSCSRNSDFFTIEPRYILSNACIRLGVKVDSVIYELLSSFCSKGPGSKQADALISTALNAKYTLPTNLQVVQHKWQNSPPLVAYNVSHTSLIDESIPDISDSSSDDEINQRETPEPTSPPANTTRSNNKTSNASVDSSGLGSSIVNSKDACETIHEMPDSPPFSAGSKSSFPPYPMRRSRSSSHGSSLPHNERLSSLGSTGRKDSVAGIPLPSASALNRKQSDQSEASINSILGRDSSGLAWRAEIDAPGNDMIIGSYGVDNTYSILMWNPKFKVEFELGSEEDGLCSSTYCVNAGTINKPTVTLQIRNPYDHPIAFAIRAHRQALMFRSHVIYPREGLKDIEGHEEFRQEFDVVGTEGMRRNEHIIIDLLICKLHDEPSWNIHRRYVILKYDVEDESKHNMGSEQRLLRKLFDGGYPTEPGHHKDLTATLKQVILHGLQCVVKNKIEEAEIIFTQALHLPLFQRLTLKAFAYICLAVIADKRRKKFNINRVNHIFKIVVELDKLLEACDTTAALQMPKTIGLIKQLKKELNLPKILDSFKTRKELAQTARIDVTETVSSQGGGMLTLEDTSVFIPGGALPVDTKVNLSNLSRTELHQSLQSSQWASMVNIITSFNIVCSPPVTHFNTPVVASISLPYDRQPLPHQPLRLLQSKYRNNWSDVTDEPDTQITLANNTLTVRTNHTGWLLVATISLDLTQILQIAVKSVFAEEPITLQVNVFGRSLSANSAEITTFITPSTKEDSILNQKKDPPTTDHKRISFPHSFKAYKGQKLQLEVQGGFNEQGIIGIEHVVDSQLEAVMTKDITFINSQPSNAKLLISKYCNVHKKWELVQEVRLTLSSLTDKS